MKSAIAISLVAILSACATHQTVPALPEQGAYYTNGAREAFEKGDIPGFATQILTALSRPSGEQKVKEFFNAVPRAKAEFLDKLVNRPSIVWTIYQAADYLSDLRTVRAASIYPQTQIDGLIQQLNAMVAADNLSGKMNISLSDRTGDFPELASPQHQRAMADRSINTLQEGGGSRQIRELLEYVERSGAASAERERIEALLPTLKIKSSELVTIESVYPKFAAARREQITVPVFVTFKNSDRIVADDIGQLLRTKIRGITWLPAANEKSITLTIERVRNDEKIMPERKQTVTYAQHEVNAFAAVLLMPRNASYIYEVVSGGSEIEYGYVVKAESGGKVIHDELIRGKVGGEYRRCENARIQNVFGGVTSAGFVANPDQERACAGGRSYSIDELRTEVFGKIVDGVLNISPIKAAHDLF